MPLDQTQAQTLIDAIAPTIDLTIDAAWRATIGSYLIMLADAADLYTAVALERTDEPAPVFRAGP